MANFLELESGDAFILLEDGGIFLLEVLSLEATGIYFLTVELNTQVVMSVDLNTVVSNTVDVNSVLEAETIARVGF